MLSRISRPILEYAASYSTKDDRMKLWERDEVEDMKKGIEYLYEFKEKLSKLHPLVLESIENLLQRPRY